MVLDSEDADSQESKGAHRLNAAVGGFHTIVPFPP
jgi:hypothetical protein